MPVYDPTAAIDTTPNELRRYWALDPEVTYLNHGAFGACPWPVLRAQDEWRTRMERRPIQFHDVAPGTYAACAGIFDAHTMDALDAPFGCTPIVVHDGESVRELEIAFKP